MIKETNLNQKKHYLYVFIYVGVFFIYNTILQYVAESKNIDFINSFTFRLIHKTINILICIYALKKIGLRKDFYLKQSVISIVISLIIIGSIYIQTFTKLKHENAGLNVFEFIVFSLNCLATGAFEEILMRVLLFLSLIYYFNKNRENLKYWKYIIVTSLIFGAMHLSHLFSYDAQSLLTQIIFATLTGVFFQALLIRFNNVFITITIHTLINFTGMVNQYFQINESRADLNVSDAAYTLLDFTFQCGIAVPLLLISYHLIKKVNIADKVYKNEP